MYINIKQKFKIIVDVDHVYNKTVYKYMSKMFFFFNICKFSDACGGVLYASNGTITSPSFPDLYPPSKNCLWEIVAPPQHRITLNFTHFDLEGNQMYQQVGLLLPL